MNPFTFRPVDPEDVDWEDNWLSNAMAWASQYAVKSWCSTPEHWTSRIGNYLWTDCPCCLVFRGITVGFAAGFVSAAIVAIVVG